MVVSFDEAHTIAEPVQSQAFTVISQLQRVMRQLDSVWIFFFFWSTAGKIHQTNPFPQVDRSDRVQPQLFTLTMPLTETGFDQLAMDIDKLTGDPTWDSKTHLEKITSLEWMAHLGRPLFV